MPEDFEIVFEPLTHWPAADTELRSYPRFRTAYDKTLKGLRVEMRALEATGPVVIQVVTKNGRTDLRRDGMLMARAQVVHPGVRLAFVGKHGPLTYSSDAFESQSRFAGQPDWQHNLRGIVLGLEALRAMDRYGITGSGEQYRGWQQIASNTGGSAGMSRDVALAVLGEESGISVPVEDMARAVKLAKKNAHPDANNGAENRWNALGQALKALGLED